MSAVFRQTWMKSAVLRSMSGGTKVPAFRYLSGASAAGPEKAMVDKLHAAFGPDSNVVVEDVSGGCGSAYNVLVESSNFSGRTRVAQAREVYQILDKEIAEMHSVNVKTVDLNKK